MSLPISFEFFPPKTPEGADKLRTVRQQLYALQPQFCSVTYGAGGSTQEGTFATVREILAEGQDAASHFSCIGATRESVRAELAQLQAMGVRRLVALRGDLPSGYGLGGAFQYASDLVAFIRTETGDAFHIEVAAYPEMHPQARSFEADLQAFATKVRAGANSAITQYFFNADAYSRFVEEAQRLGLVMSEDVARASEVFNDNLTRLSAIFEGVQRQIGAAVIPVLADFTEQVILAQTETGSFSNELQRITSNREATLAFLESVASGLAFIAESAVLLKRVIAQPFDSLSVVGKDIETWFKTELLTFYKNYGFDAQAIDAEIAKLQTARDDYVRAANDRLFNINQNPGYTDRVARFFDEQRRTVRVMGQRFVLDTEAQAREVQAIYDRFLPTLPRAPRPPANLDFSAFTRPTAAAKPDEGEAFLNQLRTRLLRTQEGEAAELRARALQIEAKGYQGVAAQAEQYIQVLEAIERQKAANQAFDAYEKEEAAARKITEGLIGGNRQRIEALQLQREMLDLSQEALARRAGISTVFVGRVESTRNQPTINSMQKLAKGLDARLSDLIREAEALAKR